MADTKNAGVAPAKTSKRKATSSKKSKKTKTKLVKGGAAVATATTVEKKQVKQEKRLTSRHKRMIEKAKVRSSMPVIEEPPEVESMKITDVAGVVYDRSDYEAMVEMYDSTIKAIKEGEVVTGTVLGVSRNDVIVDVGFKSEGIIPISEFPTPVNIAVGDEIEVFLEQIEDSQGQLILSKQKADFMRVWQNIREIHDAGTTADGRIVRRIKGGMVVDVMGVEAFLPGSQVALRQVPDFDALIGQTMELKIIKLNRTRRNIVVSRRVVLEEERDTMRSSLLQEIDTGCRGAGSVTPPNWCHWLKKSM